MCVTSVDSGPPRGLSHDANVSINYRYANAAGVINHAKSIQQLLHREQFGSERRRPCDEGAGKAIIFQRNRRRQGSCDEESSVMFTQGTKFQKRMMTMTISNKKDNTIAASTSSDQTVAVSMMIKKNI